MKMTKFALIILGLVMTAFIGCGGGGGGSSSTTGNTSADDSTSKSDTNTSNSSSTTGSTGSVEQNSSNTNSDVNSTSTQTEGSSSNGTQTAPDQGLNASGIVIDHTTDTLAPIPAEYINRARENLHIIYQGASHSRQMSRGMEALMNLYPTNLNGYKGNIYGIDLNGSSTSDKLDFKDNFEGYNSPINNASTLYSTTSAYLDSHPNVNVVFWMWCYQRDDWNGAGTEYETNIDTYISAMEKLIAEYGANGTKSRSVPVTFIYATGPNMKDRDGTAENENLTVFNYNKRIRDYAKENKRVLFDYYDIESYSPEGTYYGDGDVSTTDIYSNYTHANDLQDNNYGFGSSRTNWALSWQNSHTEGVDYFRFVTQDGTLEHTNAVDADAKVYAMWWLFARLAGWNGQ